MIKEKDWIELKNKKSDYAKKIKDLAKRKAKELDILSSVSDALTQLLSL